MRSNSFSNPFANQTRFPNAQQTAKTMEVQFSTCEIELLKYSKQIVQVQKIIGTDEIWPDQCDYAIKVLNTARTPIRSLGNVLDSTPPFSRATGINRYSILTKTHFVDEKIGNLLALLVNHKEIHRSKPQQKGESRKEIAASLDRVIENYLALIEIVQSVIAHMDVVHSYAN